MLESQKEVFAERNVQLVTVNIDTMRRHQAVNTWVAQQGFAFTIVWNETAEKNYGIDAAYKLQGTPLAYLVDTSRRIAFSHYGVLSPAELKEALEGLPAE